MGKIKVYTSFNKTLHETVLAAFLKWQFWGPLL